MSRRVWMIVAAAAILAILVLGSWATQCRVTPDKLPVSGLTMIIVPIPVGYAVGVRFNMTNHVGCELEAHSITITLRTVTYMNGTSITVGSTESQGLSQTVPQNDVSSFYYVFDATFDLRPAKIVLLIQINFGDAGTATVFDGELTAPQ